MSYFSNIVFSGENNYFLDDFNYNGEIFKDRGNSKDNFLSELYL
jgi:hypothetical protein